MRSSGNLYCGFLYRSCEDSKEASGEDGKVMDREQIERLAHLARLQVPADGKDLDRLQKNVANMVRAFSVLKRFDGEAMSHASSPIIRQRQRSFLQAKDLANIDAQETDRNCVLENAPSTFEGYFVVPKVVE